MTTMSKERAILGGEGRHHSSQTEPKGPPSLLGLFSPCANRGNLPRLPGQVTRVVWICCTTSRYRKRFVKREARRLVFYTARWEQLCCCSQAHQSTLAQLTWCALVRRQKTRRHRSLQKVKAAEAAGSGSLCTVPAKIDWILY